MRQGDTITTFYDPMISKLIVHAPDRNQAIKGLYSALDDYKVVGLPTNIKFLKRVLLNKDFRDWEFDTSFIAQNYEELIGVKQSKTESDREKAMVAIANTWLNHMRKQSHKDEASDPWRTSDNFRINQPAMRQVNLLKGEEESNVYLQYHSTNTFSVFNYDPLTDSKSVILDKVNIIVNPENNEELILRA